MKIHVIEHHLKAFDSLVDILKNHFGITVTEESMVYPERSFVNVPLKN
jgi:hypothetical protein